MNECRLCPRECGVDRATALGFCKAPDQTVVAKAYLHRWEEPCISGQNGSGTIFFSPCNLKCVFCQNYEISHRLKGRRLTDSELAELMLRLQSEGAHNINLVTPTPYAENICSAVAKIRDKLHIPVVYNCSGFEKREIIRSLKGTVDIFLTDVKFKDSEKSEKYLHAADYYKTAMDAADEMIKTAGAPRFNGGLLKSGVIVRHLVMPGGYRDSLEILRDIHARFGTENLLLSLMSQYTPCGNLTDFPEINRRVTSFEYGKAAALAAELGFRGYTQQRESAQSAYIPEFNDGGLI